MKKKAVGGVLLIIFLSACQEGSNPDIGLEINESVSISSSENNQDKMADMETDRDAWDQLDIKEEHSVEAEESANDMPEFQNEYAKAIEAYRAFLAGELYFTLEDEEEETRITIAPNHVGNTRLLIWRKQLCEEQL